MTVLFDFQTTEDKFIEHAMKQMNMSKKKAEALVKDLVTKGLFKRLPGKILAFKVDEDGWVHYLNCLCEQGGCHGCS